MYYQLITILIFLIGLLLGYLLSLLISKRAEQKRLLIQRLEHEEKEKTLEHARQENNALQMQNSLLLQQKEHATTILEQNKREYEERIKEQKDNFEAQIKVMTSQFQALSEDITKRRSEELTRTNISQMDAILKPLKLQIEIMQKSFNDGRQSGLEQATRLEKHINMLIEQSLSVGNQAEILADALRLKSKVQGNWGETILEQMLQAEGLVKGIHYTPQATLEGITKTY